MSNTDLPTQMDSKSKPVALLGAIAAAATAATGALAVIPGIPGWIPAAVGALGIIVTAALAAYTHNSVTPWVDVAAKQTPTGELVAGPAAAQPTGSQVEVVTPVQPPTTPVTVTPDGL